MLVVSRRNTSDDSPVAVEAAVKAAAEPEPFFTENSTNQEASPSASAILSESENGAFTSQRKTQS